MLAAPVILEVVVALCFIWAAVARGKSYAWELALTSAVAIFYD